MPVFDYEDIQLVPNKCIVKSRSEIDTRVKFGPMTFNIPVVPANMQTVIDEDLAIWLAQNGYFYIMHRFEENERVPFVKKDAPTWTLCLDLSRGQTTRISIDRSTCTGKLDP